MHSLYIFCQIHKIYQNSIVFFQIRRGILTADIFLCTIMCKTKKKSSYNLIHLVLQASSRYLHLSIRKSFSFDWLRNIKNPYCIALKLKTLEEIQTSQFSWELGICIL